VLSLVKLRAALAGETLPAGSVWRTDTVLLPSAAEKVADQVLPPSTLYSSLALVSAPEVVSRPLWVILSVADVPVSTVSDRLGAAGAMLSSLKVKAALADTLPAASV